MFPRILKMAMSINRPTGRRTASFQGGELEGMVVIVTGSTYGLGFNIARGFAKRGAKVVISSREQKNVDRARKTLEADKIDILGMVCHVGKAEHRKKLLEETIKHYGRLDMFIANAATNSYSRPLPENPEDPWVKARYKINNIFNPDAQAALIQCKEAIPYMEKCSEGVILVFSVAGFFPEARHILGPLADGRSKTELLPLGMIAVRLESLIGL